MAPITTFFNLKTYLPSSSPTKVLATGFFDLLHSEHQRFLQKAKAAGHHLTVGVESDFRARLLKGPARPFQPQSLRAYQLSCLSFVDLVVVLPPNFHLSSLRRQLLSLLRPQILAVSSHSPHQLQKDRLMRQFGGRLCVVHHHNPLVSTTLIAQKLYNQT